MTLVNYRNHKSSNNLFPFGNFDNRVFQFAIIDTLFLPYFWLVSVPFSLPVVIYWSLKRHNQIKVSKEFKYFKIMFILMIFSTLVGILFKPINIYENIVFLVKYYYIFMLYFLFKGRFECKGLLSKRYLITFVFFVLSLAIVYYFDKGLYHNLKLIWNYKSNVFVELRYIGLVGYRYSFIWMDPNNIGYMITAVVMFLLVNIKTNVLDKTIMFASLLFVLLTTMSNGALLAFLVSSLIYVIIRIVEFHWFRKIGFAIKPINLLFLISVFILIIYLLPRLSSFFESTIVVESINRMLNNSGDSRLKIWNDILSNISFSDMLLYLFLGKGGVTIAGGNNVAPHNGHLYWILGYGVISYFIFMYIVFRIRRNTPIIRYMWLIPVFIGFSINTMIGEMKLFGLIMLLVASVAGNTKIQRNGSL